MWKVLLPLFIVWVPSAHAAVQDCDTTWDTADATDQQHIAGYEVQITGRLNRITTFNMRPEWQTPGQSVLVTCVAYGATDAGDYQVRVRAMSTTGDPALNSLWSAYVPFTLADTTPPPEFDPLSTITNLMVVVTDPGQAMANPFDFVAGIYRSMFPPDMETRTIDPVPDWKRIDVERDNVAQQKLKLPEHDVPRNYTRPIEVEDKPVRPWHTNNPGEQSVSSWNEVNLSVDVKSQPKVVRFSRAEAL